VWRGSATFPTFYSELKMEVKSIGLTDVRCSRGRGPEELTKVMKNAKGRSRS